MIAYCVIIMQILRLEVDSCSSYTTCTSCAGSRDPLCGWCVLEGKCSRDLTCRHHHLMGRWIYNEQECPLNQFQWDRSNVALDNLQPVSISISSDMPDGCLARLLPNS